MLCFAIREFRVIDLRAIGFFSLLLFCLHAEVQGQTPTTIWEEDFEDDVENGDLPDPATGVNGDWSATDNGGTMSIVATNEGKGFKFKSQNGQGRTCTWDSEPIDITGYENINVGYQVVDEYGDATITPSVAITGSNAIITITISPDKKDYRTIDNIVLTGTPCTPTTWYADTDGDGLGDPATAQVACAQPTGYVDNNTDDDPNLNPNDYDGTVLYPGDVYFSYGQGSTGADASYVGLTVLVDIAEGTKLVLSTNLNWLGGGSNQWYQIMSSGVVITTAVEWTAPAGGVQAGTEVILFDVAGPSTGNAYCASAESPITSNGTALNGGASCGTFAHMNDKRADFVDQDQMWIFQPNTGWSFETGFSVSGDSKCRHLNCIGNSLSYLANQGTGTLIAGSDWSAVMDARYSFESSSFSASTNWVYNGEASPSAFGQQGSQLVTRSIQDAVSFKATDGNVPYDFANNTSSIAANPNGSIALQNSAAWNNLANGLGIVDSGGQPDLDIVIGGNSSLVIDAESEVLCRDITVTEGVFQSCDGNGRTVGASGNVTLGASGVFNGGQGRLKLTGTNPQVLDANNSDDSLSTRFRVKNLEIQTNAKTVKGHVKMKPGGALEFNQAPGSRSISLDESVNSSLTFESDATGTASIGPCVSANFVVGAEPAQEFTFQRYIPADTDGSTWVNIGAYVTGTTVSDWTSANSGMLIFKYNESNYGSIGAGWNYLWDGTTELTPGSGYMALIPQNQDALISVTGAFQIGDVDIDLTFTDDPNQSDATVDGWNLVSNPYPSAVDLAQAISRVDGVEAFYIYDNAGAGGYTTVNENGVGGSDTLDVGQSFWVKVSANKTLTFQETDKVTGSNTFIRELPESFEGSIGVHIVNESANQWSKAFIQFDAESSVAFDQNEDAVFYGDPSANKLNVWMTAESGEKLSIQSAGGVATTPSIPLHVTSGAGGTLRISGLTDASTPADICAVVEDLETGERAQLGRDVLEVNLPANTEYNDRFFVHFTPEPSMTWESTVCNGLDVTMAGEAWESWDASWSANDGSASGTGMPNELEDGEYTFEFSLPEAGCVQAVDVTVETACLGDFNVNGERDVVDLLVLLSGLPTGALESEFAIEADCDCDGAVTVNDMLTFLTVFGTLCD